MQSAKLNCAICEYSYSEYFSSAITVFKIFAFSIKPFKSEGSLIISRFLRRAVLLKLHYQWLKKGEGKRPLKQGS